MYPTNINFSRDVNVIIKYLDGIGKEMDTVIYEGTLTKVEVSDPDYTSSDESTITLTIDVNGASRLIHEKPENIAKPQKKTKTSSK